MSRELLILHHTSPNSFTLWGDCELFWFFKCSKAIFTLEVASFNSGTLSFITESVLPSTCRCRTCSVGVSGTFIQKKDVHPVPKFDEEGCRNVEAVNKRNEQIGSSSFEPLLQLDPKVASMVNLKTWGSSDSQFNWRRQLSWEKMLVYFKDFESSQGRKHYFLLLIHSKMPSVWGENSWFSSGIKVCSNRTKFVNNQGICCGKCYDSAGHPV